jgi:putative ABC transport system substrate-binding protein
MIRPENRSRRSFIRRLALCGGALPLTAYAQRSVPRIGFLIGNGTPTLQAAFEEELLKLGYVVGKNLILEKRLSRPNTSDTTVQAAELAQMNLDLIVAAALPQALAVRQANPAMPMVIGTCPGMVSNGFAQSVKRPGGHYTGMDELPPGVTAKRLRLLKTAAPRLKRVALLSTTPGRGGHEIQLAEAEQTARALRLTVQAYRAATLKQLEAALTNLANDGMEGLVNFQGGLSLANRELIVNFVAQHRIVAMYQSAFFVDVGGLMAWAPNQEEQFREAARYVHRILRGAQPCDLPVHFPRRYYLSLNQNAAASLGLALPRALVAQAHQVSQ